MSKPLHVLILEDRPDDVALIVNELRRAGLAPDWRHVETEADYLAALDPAPEVILAANLLSRYHPLQALREIQARHLGIPFIVVVDPNGEPEGVECMREGADECVFKDRLTRLGRVVLRALEMRRLRVTHRQTEAALRESEERLRQLTENINEVFWLVDISLGKLLYVSPTFEHLWGRSSESLYANHLIFLEAIHPEDRERARDAVRRHHQGELTQVEYRIVRPDGSLRWVRDRAFPVMDGQGKLYRIAGLAQDITEHKQVQKSLTLFRTLLDRTNEIIEVVDPETGRFLDVNERACLLHGYSREEYLALSVADIDPLVKARSWRDVAADVRRSGFLSLESQHRRKDGSFFPVEVNATLVHLDRDYLVAVAHDISERKKTERILREYAQRLVEVQEAERGHLARELHDEVGQSLTGLKLMLEAIRSRPNEPLGTRADEACSLVHDLMERVRDLSLDLRPSMLDDLGLLPALLWYFKRYSKQTGIQVAFKHRGLKGRFPREVETTAYRVVQESLTNVARHARVNSVLVHVLGQSTRLRIRVQDRGAGFDPSIIQDNHVTNGLNGMTERVALLYGKFLVESAPAEGTTVNAVLPLRLPVRKDRP